MTEDLAVEQPSVALAPQIEALGKLHNFFRKFFGNAAKFHKKKPSGPRRVGED